MLLGGIFDLQEKTERLEEVNGLLEDPDLWNDPDKASKLGKERQSLTTIVDSFKKIYSLFEDILTLEEMSKEDGDIDAHNEALAEADSLEQTLERLELERMFSGEHDNSPCYMDIKSGSGGTEAQDWAEMIMRMYIKFGEKHGFNVTVTECSEGEVAGIKSATIKFVGDHAYGWL